jgi:hypothetical protein
MARDLTAISENPLSPQDDATLPPEKYPNMDVSTIGARPREVQATKIGPSNIENVSMPSDLLTATFEQSRSLQDGATLPPVKHTIVDVSSSGALPREVMTTNIGPSNAKNASMELDLTAISAKPRSLQDDARIPSLESPISGDTDTSNDLTDASKALCVVHTDASNALCTGHPDAPNALCVVHTDASNALCTGQPDAPNALCVVPTDALNALCVVPTDAPNALGTMHTDASNALCMMHTDASNALGMAGTDTSTALTDASKALRTMHTDAPNAVGMGHTDTPNALRTVHTDASNALCLVHTDASNDLSMVDTDASNALTPSLGD